MVNVVNGQITRFFHLTLFLYLIIEIRGCSIAFFTTATAKWIDIMYSHSSWKSKWDKWFELKWNFLFLNFQHRNIHPPFIHFLNRRMKAADVQVCEKAEIKRIEICVELFVCLKGNPQMEIISKQTKHRRFRC